MPNSQAKHYIDKLSRKETKDLEKAQKESDAAYTEYRQMKDVFTKAQDDGTSQKKLEELKNRMFTLEEEARAKEQVLRGLQDFCD